MIKRLAFPSVFLSSILIKSLIFSIGFPEAILFLAMSALFGYVYFTENKKEKPINEDVKKQILELQEKLEASTTHNEQRITDSIKELQEIKTFLNTTKLMNKPLGNLFGKQ